MSVPNLNYHLYLNIEGDILRGDYSDVVNSNGIYSATHNILINLEDLEYNTYLKVHPDGNQLLEISNETSTFKNGYFGLQDSFVGIISKSLFSFMNKRAAIRNDIDIEDEMYNQVNNEITNIISTSSFKNGFFDQYVNTNKFNSQETGIINYNFLNIKLQFGLSLHGQVEHYDNEIKPLSLIYSGKGIYHNSKNIINITSNNIIEQYTESSYQFNILFTLQQK